MANPGKQTVTSEQKILLFSLIGRVPFADTKRIHFTAIFEKPESSHGFGLAA